MCTVSMVAEGWRDQFPQRWPHYQQWTTTIAEFPPTRAEFDALKKEVEELRKLLDAAKKFDEATGQPDCHVDEKVAFIKKIAEFVGVDLSEVLK